MHHATPTILLVALLAAGVLSGCASKGLSEGRELISGGQTEAGIARLQAGIAEEPDNLELKTYYYTQREALASKQLTQAQLELDAGRFDAAEKILQSVRVIHPENPRAKTLLTNLPAARAHYALVDDGHRALADNKPAVATDKARAVLAQNPGHAGATDLLRKIQIARAQADNAPPELGAAARKTVTLEFRDAPLRSVFDMMSRQSGINFVFDKDVKLDTKATLFARNTSVNDAIAMLLSTGGLAKKVMSPTALLVYPDTPQKQKQYQELMVKSFYLGNGDAKSTMAMLRVLIKSKDMYVDERLNQLVMRDTPDAIRLAEKLIAAQDIAEPEVMLKVEIFEVKRSRLLDLGIQYPNQFSVITDTPPLTLENLQNISAKNVAVSPTPTVNVKQEDGDVNILANPRIRVKNREKAKIHIGDKVPVITSNTTSTGVISESVSYLDVGLKLDVEPAVQMRDDVQIKVALEVSNIVKEIRSTSGTLTYQIGTRNASTTLRLRDGETQVLAGLISDEDRSSASGIPGLASLPLLGRLFSTQRDERIKTEIVLLITPQILRSAAAEQPAVTEFRGGTENAIGGGGGGGGGQAPVQDWVAPPELPPAGVFDNENSPQGNAEPPPALSPANANANATIPLQNAPVDQPLTQEEIQKLNTVSPVFSTQ